MNLSSDNFKRPQRSPLYGRASHRSAFTLVEMISVLAIIGILSTIFVTTFSSVESGMVLKSGSDKLASQIELARNNAVALNKKIRLCFYQYADSSVPGEQAGNPSSGKFRAVQAFQIAADGSSQPLTPEERLPLGAYISSLPELSNLIGAATSSVSPFYASGQSLGYALPSVGENYICVSIEFYPDGSTDLPTTTPSWFLTLVNLNDAQASHGNPKNFATLQLVASDGHVITYRP